MKKQFYKAVLYALMTSRLLWGVSGMFPVNMMNSLPLNDAGLDIPVSSLYNGDSISIIDGIVRIGGCSGAFISADGLILTNHHCAFQAIQDNSTPENDLLDNGFISKYRQDELPAPGYTVRITESYEDVSEKVLSVITPDMNYVLRTQAIEKQINALEKEAERTHPGYRADISEMFKGKSYVIFYYTYLRDVRLVYAPPRSIGNFGGEKDNWTWPRHTGDFSLMRVYVSPDGSASDYSAANVPYHPKKVIPVNPNGVSEGDFIFILGYPGKTFRHRSSHFIEYRQNTVMPRIVDWYQWQIKLFDELSLLNASDALKLQSRSKGLANVEKKYRGQLRGMKRLDLLNETVIQERNLGNQISDETMRQQYVEMMNGLNQFYTEREARYPADFVALQLRYGPEVFNLALNICEAAEERAKPDDERKSKYTDRHWSDTQKQWHDDIARIVPDADKEILKHVIIESWKLPADQKIQALQALMKKREPKKQLSKYLDQAFHKTNLCDGDYVMSLLDKSPSQIQTENDPLIKLAAAIYPYLKDRDEREDGLKGREDDLYSRLLDIRQEVLKDEFVPDANGTLRFTYGYVEGYHPVDGITAQPFTTLAGILEKQRPVDPFHAPDKLIQLIKTTLNESKINQPKNRVPVCFLYSLDTTGGNSGSAVLNCQGELVGLNFDRTFDATINDYRWDHSISRSIGVDIRYILWIINEFSGADHLMNEILFSI